MQEIYAKLHAGFTHIGGNVLKKSIVVAILKGMCNKLVFSAF